MVRSVMVDFEAPRACEAGQWLLRVRSAWLGSCADSGSGLLGLGGRLKQRWHRQWVAQRWFERSGMEMRGGSLFINLFG